MDDVILQLYTVSILGLFSYTHTEILWKGLDIYLSRKDGPIIAIHVEKEKFKAFGFKECKRINLGVSLMGLEEFTDHFNLMSRDYTNYNVLTANCRHLSIDVLTILEPVNATYAIMMLKKMNYKLDMVKMPIELMKAIKVIVDFIRIVGFALAPLILLNDWIVFGSTVFSTLALLIRGTKEQMLAVLKRIEKLLELHIEITEHFAMANDLSPLFTEPTMTNDNNFKYTIQWSSASITLIAVSITITIVALG